MWEKIRSGDRQMLAWATIAVSIVFFLAINTLANTALTSTRLDLTEDRLFTLSDGTKDVLSTLDEPIDLRFYYSERFDEIGPNIARHSDRVRELLDEYERLSGGKVRIEIFDPQPFSTEEDLAVSDGLQGLPFDQSGARAYFGVSGTNSTDDIDAIGYLAPERSPFLEYDLTRLVSNLSEPEKPVVGLVSDLPLQGTQFDNYTPWLIVDGLRQFFDVKFLDKDSTELPENMEVLVIAGAHTIKDELLYEMDQFVVSGGRVLAFADPYAESMALAGPTTGQLPPPGVGQAAIEPLLNAWGVDVVRGDFVANLDDAVRVGFPNPETGQQVAVDYVAWLTLQGDRFSRDDAVSAQLQRIVVSSSGAFMTREGAKTVLAPLIFTTPTSDLMSAFEIAQQPNPIALLDRFEPQDTVYNLAARVTGKVNSAFPDGPPEKMFEAAEDPEALRSTHKAAADSDASIILVGDVDMLANQNWAQVQDVAGEQVAIPTANNADFFINAIDNLRGSHGLVGLRGRGLSIRPFQVIEEMRSEADNKFRNKEQELLTRIAEMDETIERLQREEQTTGVILTSQQQDEIDDFRLEMLDMRSELRDVQRSLREDVETLERQVRVFNIWAVPLLIAVLAVFLAVIRRIRRARYHRAVLH
ncbi:MAG: ABC transporter [Alphaproteobacteria bacterium]|nr:ABC transporter [Alphaproteobacteria bacterium]